MTLLSSSSHQIIMKNLFYFSNQESFFPSSLCVIQSINQSINQSIITIQSSQYKILYDMLYHVVKYHLLTMMMMDVHNNMYRYLKNDDIRQQQEQHTRTRQQPVRLLVYVYWSTSTGARLQVHVYRSRCSSVIHNNNNNTVRMFIAYVMLSHRVPQPIKAIDVTMSPTTFLISSTK